MELKTYAKELIKMKQIILQNNWNKCENYEITKSYGRNQ